MTVVIVDTVAAYHTGILIRIRLMLVIRQELIAQLLILSQGHPTPIISFICSPRL